MSSKTRILSTLSTVLTTYLHLQSSTRFHADARCRGSAISCNANSSDARGIKTPLKQAVAISFIPKTLRLIKTLNCRRRPPVAQVAPPPSPLCLQFKSAIIPRTCTRRVCSTQLHLLSTRPALLHIQTAPTRTPTRLHCPYPLPTALEIPRRPFGARAPLSLRASTAATCPSSARVRPRLPPALLWRVLVPLRPPPPVGALATPAVNIPN